MRFLTLILTVITLFSFKAYALNSPEDLLERSSQGRIELQEVIFELEQNLKNMREPETFRKYFSIIPELDSLSKLHDLEQIHPRAVKKLANTMAAHGLRWIRLSSDSRETVLEHLVWMDAQTTFRLLEYQRNLVDRLETEEEYLNFLQNLDHILSFIDGKYIEEWYIEQGYRDLGSLLAYNRLTKLNFDSVEAHLKWAPFLKNVDNASAYANILYRQSISLLENEEEKSLRLLKITTSFFDYILQNPFQSSQRVQIPLSSVLLESIDKAFLNSWKSDLETVASSMAYLNIESLSFLADRWSNYVTGLSKEQDPDSYAFLLTSLSQLLVDSGLTLKAKSLNQTSLPKLSFLKLSAANAEGIYSVSTPGGEKHSFSLIKANNETFIASLATTTDFSVTKTFFHTLFDVQKNKFTAFQVSPGLGSSESNDLIEFSFDENGTVSVNSHAYFQNKTARGKKDISFTNSLPTPRDTKITSGSYSGELTDSKGRVRNFDISLNVLSKSAFAKMNLDPHIHIDFITGDLDSNGVLSLTSSRFTSGAAAHIKLVNLGNNSLEGIYTVTGQSDVRKIKLELKERSKD